MYKIDEKTIRELLEQNWKILAENEKLIILKKETKKIYFIK